MYEGFQISEDDIALLAAHGLKPIAGAQEYDFGTGLGGLGAGLSGGGTAQTQNNQLPPGVPPGSYPDPNMPGVWITPWGQRGFIAPATPGNPLSGGWVDIPDRYFDGPGGGGYPPAHADPRYWELQYAQLDQNERHFVQELERRYQQMGMERDMARQQALAQLIMARNRGAIDLAGTAGQIAAQAAQFAANPRDAVSDLLFRNAIADRGQGGAPFGALGGDEFSEYQSGLERKFMELFGGVGQDLRQARIYRDAIPPVEFFGPEIREQLGLAPTPPLGGAATPAAAPAAAAPAPTAAPTVGPTAAPAAAPAAPTQEPNALQALIDRLKFSPNFRLLQQQAVTNSEGGLNINVKHPAVVVDTVTGQIISTLAEPDPVTGEAQPEQLIVKPLQSVVKRRKENEQAAKASGMQVRPSGSGVPQMQEGGTVSATPDDFFEQLRQWLARLGGPGGGVGQGAEVSHGLYDPRLLAGAPYNELLQDPDAMRYAESAYSARGISPDTLHATIRKFTPRGIINNMPRTSFAQVRV